MPTARAADADRPHLAHPHVELIRGSRFQSPLVELPGLVAIQEVRAAEIAPGNEKMAIKPRVASSAAARRSLL